MTGMFVGIHALLAANTGVPEFMISDDEGKAFTTAAQNVLRHYSVQTTQKTLDMIAFIGIAGTIYAPRIASFMIRTRGEKSERKANGKGDGFGLPDVNLNFGVSPAPPEDDETH